MVCCTMSHRRSIIDIIEGVVNSMTFPVKVNSVIANVDGTQTLQTCDIFHAQPGFGVTIAGNDYTIVSINADLHEITISAGVAVATPVTFNLYAPFFFHGTPRQTNVELTQVMDASSKTPMVYLLEEVTETFFNAEDIRERESVLRLFFLTQADFERWLTEDFHTNAVEPMRRLLDGFIEALGNDKTIDTEEIDYSVTNRQRFGVFITNSGYEKALFSDKLSGCELNITIPVRKKNICVVC